MNQSANVTSIDAVRAFRTALVKFEENARDAVISLELEIRRAVQARNALERCQLKYGSEEAPSCYEQKKDYERAKRRLRYCEDQVRKVKQWAQIIRQELTQFDGQKAQMTVCIDTDLPRAIAAIGNMLNALERYAQATGNAGPSPTSVGSEEITKADSAARPDA
jgi:hypothetical protein